MSVEIGQNQRLYVANTSSPYTFTAITGQRGLTFDAPQQTIDIASKTSGVYGAIVGGRKALKITVTGVLDLPDASGLERVYALIAAAVSVPARFRIMKVDVSPPKIRFDATMYAMNWREGRDDQQAATYSFDLSSDGSSPLVDDLTPP